MGGRAISLVVLESLSTSSVFCAFDDCCPGVVPDPCYHLGFDSGMDLSKERSNVEKLMAAIHADSFQTTSSPFVFRLTGVRATIYQPTTASYSKLKLRAALIDEKTAALIYGPNLSVTMIP
jgi:hypothetical protein